ncbi:tetratricopeptide repeat protein [Bacteroidota bacterium]
MKSISFSISGIILFLLIGCSGGKYIEQTKAGEEFFHNGEFSKTLELSEQIISETELKGKHASGSVYFLAGASAYELGNFDKSLEYLLKAQEQEYSGEDIYVYLAGNYRHIDNLSKEINTLENYLSKYPQGKIISKVRERLFQTCLESENFDLADELWSNLDSISREDLTNLEVYLNLNSMQKNTELCNSLGKQILDKDPNNESALKWFGELLFWRAENTYLSQMKAYRENRTHKQYAILLEAFKQVNTDFKKSRDHFVNLYKLYPKPEYASYLANIYTRLEDEEKANYYKRRAE